MGVAATAHVNEPCSVTGALHLCSYAALLTCVRRQVLTVDRLESVITPPKSRFIYVNAMTLLAALAQAALLLQVRARGSLALSHRGLGDGLVRSARRTDTRRTSEGGGVRGGEGQGG